MASKAQQLSFLKTRLHEVYESKPRRWADISIPEPQSIKTARLQLAAADKIISRFDSKVNKAKERRWEKIKAAHSRCQQLVLFGDPKAALKAIEKFESTKF